MRIESIVMNGLLAEPRAINVRAKPKPPAAPKAKRSGLREKPPENSGPLAQNAPISASTTPASFILLRISPPTSATATGRVAPSALIGETTPMRPVARPE